jgi:hypothetical protein
MEPAAKGTTPEIITEEIVAEAKEEAKEAPSRLRQELHRLAAAWERVSVRPRVSETDVVEGLGLGGMYGREVPGASQGA